MEVKMYRLGGPGGRTVILCRDAEEYGHYGSPVFVGKEEVDGHRVSTIFTGNPWPKKNYQGPPLVFETAVFWGGVTAGNCQIIGHWDSWEKAEEMHHRTVLQVLKRRKKRK